MKRLLLFTVFPCFVFSLTACSIALINSQPPQVDLSVLHVGAQRDEVTSKLGKPAYTIQDGTGTYDAYIICQGRYSPGEQNVRKAYYVIADLFTYGLWELVGTNVEKSDSGELVKAWACYDSDGTMVKLENLDLRGVPPSGLGPEAAAAMKAENPQKRWIPPEARFCN